MPGRKKCRAGMNTLAVHAQPCGQQGPALALLQWPLVAAPALPPHGSGCPRRALSCS